ncbi:progranulin isoform X2 [Folsomia candida]|uniref:progranulin isoform X2 n=1 Tax=Folsomia candida TaxID=158441 RepID=UPI0016050BC4|nr:progranulin isoform X2 [Folsomia candida]
MGKHCGVFVVLLHICILIAFVSGDTCPDHKTRCSKTQTCCSDNRGGYGCCPYPGATCCNDGQHCCPHGSKCDTVHSRCIPNEVSEPEWWTMIYKSFTREEWLAQNLITEDGVDSGHNATMGS